MPVTNYHTCNGRILGETTAGVRTDYLTDALGSVTATVNSSQTIVNTYRYKPYGEQLAKTGVGADPRFLWTGDTGSRTTLVAWAEQYNRARHFGTKQAQWTAVDRFWPNEWSLAYVNNNPTVNIDPYGQMPKIGACDNLTKRVRDDMVATIEKLCRAISDPKQMSRIRVCVALQGINVADLAACLRRFCAGEGRVTCEGGPGCVENWSYYYCVRKGPNCPRGCEIDRFQIPGACATTKCDGKGNPSQQITLCDLTLGDYIIRRCDCPYNPPDLPCPDVKEIILHEILHVCGQCDGLDRNAHQVPFSKAARCIKSVLGIL